jgi:hypothetical protein
MSGIAFLVTIVFGVLSKWIIPKGSKSRAVLLLVVWILILGGYKGLKLPNNYEVDRSRHIITKVTGFDKQQNTITDQRRSQKLRDIPMRPENTNFKGERYLKTEIIRQFDLPLKLRFAAGNLESKKVDTIPVKINCINETAQQKTVTINVKTDNMLVFYEVPSEFSRVQVEIPSINSEVYPKDDHVNLRVFSNRVVNGYEAVLVNIGKCAFVVSLLYILVALICLVFDVSPCPFLESINYWQETKNILWNIGQDVINLCCYFWLKKWLILISSVIGLICLGIAYFNYNRMPEFPIEHSRSNLLWAARMIWSITALIAFLIINNRHKATKIFWIHFIGWSIIFLLHWLVVNPGYFSTDSYYTIASIVALNKDWLVLWGSSMGLDRLLAMVSISLVPYFGFFIILQALFTAFVIGFIAQNIKKTLSNSTTVLIVLNILLFCSIPFQCFTLAFVREAPYCLFLLMASVSIFLIQLQKNIEELKIKNYLVGIIAIFLMTQFRVDGLMAVGAFFCLLLFRLFHQSMNFYYSNFLRPVFCFILIAVIATVWCGKASQNSTTSYGNSVLALSLVSLYVLPDLADSDPDQTKTIILKGLKWDEIVAKFRNNKGFATNNLAWNMVKSPKDIDTRICFENPFLYINMRIKCFFQYANMLGHGHNGIHDGRTYTGQNVTFLSVPQTIGYVRTTGLIPQKTGYPSNRLFKIDTSLRRYNNIIGKFTWTFLPEFLLLLLAIALYKYFPATAAVALLILSVFPPIFLMTALFCPMYYLFAFYGGLIIIPFMATEFRYRRSERESQLL